MTEEINGFIDIQINGFDGVDFSKKGLTVADVQRATKKLVEKGTWAYCPTIITSQKDCIKENAKVIIEALSEAPYSTHFLGIHLEGPFISPEDGNLAIRSATIDDNVFPCTQSNSATSNQGIIPLSQ